MKAKKLLILLIYLIVLNFKSYSQDTITKVPNRILAQIYTDLTICETSLASCKDREVSYLNSLIISSNNESMYSEALYNDSLVILDLTTENNTYRKNKIILEKSNKNLEKSNKLFKLLSISGWSGFGLTLLIILL